MTDRYRIARLCLRALCACVAMICLAWVLTAYARKAEAGSQFLTVSVTRPQDVAPVVKQLLPPLEAVK
jgi:hypothetical protein